MMLPRLYDLVVAFQIVAHHLTPVVSTRINLREEISGQRQGDRLFPGGFVAGFFLSRLHGLFFGVGGGISLTANSNNSRAVSTCRDLKLRREARKSLIASRIANSMERGILFRNAVPRS